MDLRNIYLEFFGVLEDVNSNANIQIKWYYEEDDEAIQSLGEHYKSVVGIPFELMQYIET